MEVDRIVERLCNTVFDKIFSEYSVDAVPMEDDEFKPTNEMVVWVAGAKLAMGFDDLEKGTVLGTVSVSLKEAQLTISVKTGTETGVVVSTTINEIQHRQIEEDDENDD